MLRWRSGSPPWRATRQRRVQWIHARRATSRPPESCRPRGENTVRRPPARAGRRLQPPGLARRGASEPRRPGKYLAYEESGRRVVVPVVREWTRIGRSLAADVRFDDATVSRRHALVVSQERRRTRAGRPLAQRRLRQRPPHRVEPAAPTATRSPSAATRSSSWTPPRYRVLAALAGRRRRLTHRPWPRRAWPRRSRSSR